MKTHPTATELFKRAFDRMTRKLSLSDKLTAEEQLENVLKEDRRQRFIADILSIRQSGHYVPDYNKPKKHTDYKLVVVKDSVETIVSGNTFIKHERPENFVGADGSLINAYGNWFTNIKEAHANQLEAKRLQELQRLQRENVMSDFEDALIRKMLVVD